MKPDRCAHIVGCFCVALVLGSASCASIDVKRVGSPGKDTQVPGIRYSLPKPFLRVSPPGKDASFTADIEYLPNSDYTYAIHAESALATHTLNVKVENGLLTEVSWKGDDSAIAAQLAESAAAVGAKKIEIDAQERKEEKEKSKKKEEAIETAAKAVEDAKLEVDVAKAEQAALGNEDGPADRLKARQKLAAAEEKLKLAEARHTALLAGRASTEVVSPRSAAGSPATPPTFPDVYGPLLYAIDEVRVGDQYVLTLRPVPIGGEIQPKYPTAAIKGALKTIALVTTGQVVFQRTLGTGEQTIKVTHPLEKVTIEAVDLADGDESLPDPANHLSVTWEAGAEQFQLADRGTLAPGAYIVSLGLEPKPDKAKPATLTVPVVIVP